MMKQVDTPEAIIKRLEEVERRLPDLIAENKGLKDDLQEFSNTLATKQGEIESARLGVLDLQGTIATLRNEAGTKDREIDHLKARIKSMSYSDPSQPQEVGLPIQVNQSLPLEKVITTIQVEEKFRPLPSVDTLTTRGKLVALIADGKLNVKRSEKDIKAMLANPETIIFAELAKLVDEEILIKSKTTSGNVFFVKSPDVRVEKK